MMLYILILFLITFLGKIPAKQSMIIGRILGDVMFYLDGRHRRVALDNLRYTYGCKMGSDVRRDIVKGVFRNLCLSIFEVSWLLGASPEDIDKRIQVNGAENVIDAFSKGKGVLIISGHVGAWELLPYVIAKAGIVLNIVYRPLDFKPLNKFVEKFRSMFGAHLISTKFAMFKINEAINRGEAVGLLIDQSADWYNGVWVKFFGHRTCTSTGAARIALDTLIPVLPVFIFRESDKFKVYFKEVVPLVNTGDRIKDIEMNISNYTEIIEAEIRRYPEQWFWVHRRWKNKAYSPLSGTKF